MCDAERRRPHRRVYINERDGIPIADPFATTALHVVELRVVTKTKSDAVQICELLEREFDVDTSLSMSFDAAEASNVRIGEPGYLGRIFYDFPRIVVLLTAERLALPEWSEFDGMRAVVEVPSLLQRAWFDIDRKVLRHISDSSYPDELRQKIVQVAALLAQADAEITGLDEASTRLEAEYESAIAQGDLSLDLNMSSYLVYLRDSVNVAQLVAIAEAAGMEAGAEVPFPQEDDLWIVRRCGCHRVNDLDEFLRKAEPRAAELLAQLRELTFDEDGFVPIAFPEAVVSWLLLVLTRADAEVVALARYRDSIKKAVNTLIGNRVER